MESVLIKSYDVPANLRKQAAKYLSLDLYTDRLVGKGGRSGDVTYFFRNYMDVTWTPASLATQFAQVVFITHENASNYVSANNINSFLDMNKIPFCSGMWSYAPANDYAKSLCMDIKDAMAKYHEAAANHETTQAIPAASSVADEIKNSRNCLILVSSLRKNSTRRKSSSWACNYQ